MELHEILIALVIGAIIGILFHFFTSSSSSSSSTTTTIKKDETETTTKARDATTSHNKTAPKNIPDVTILYASQRGTSKQCAKELEEILSTKLRPFKISCMDVKTLASVEDLRHHKRLLFIVATYEGGTPPPSAANFCTELLDLVNDFRVSRDFFANQRYAVLGLGDAHYAQAGNFCKFAKDITIHFTTLGAQKYISTMCVDEPQVSNAVTTFAHKVAAAISRGTSAEQEKAKKADFISSLKSEKEMEEQIEFEKRERELKKKDSAAAKQSKKKNKNKKTSSASASAAAAAASDNDNNNSCCCKKENDDDENENDEEEEDDDEYNEDEDNEDDDSDIDDEEADIEELISAPRKQLLFPRLRRNLEKQGYGIIGTHSGVKLCRWTKAMLRGRGGCYKHSLYNISSFQCMEMTPSLACANKCVFCWRHHTNPVSRTFAWEPDPPQFLIDGSIAKHQQMMKAMRGVPGVLPQRLAESMNVKHCALSLVGEPIMYPHINEFMTMLHKKKISSFMVTNAQFPEEMKRLIPVTQLYVSVDASTPEDLKRIDRPLFEDYWERFIECIKELSRKPQRTVFRLTLVNNYNVSHLREYTDLIRLGNPHFVEVKGVTFCGAGSASDLTMKNVPWHREVCNFSEDLVKLLPGYEIACEHEHSCTILIAKTSFKKQGKWHTWIDYDKFFELFETGRSDFTALDYCCETPDWAVYQSKEAGFDPKETRHKRGEAVTWSC